MRLPRHPSACACHCLAAAACAYRRLAAAASFPALPLALARGEPRHSHARLRPPPPWPRASCRGRRQMELGMGRSRRRGGEEGGAAAAPSPQRRSSVRPWSHGGLRQAPSTHGSPRRASRGCAGPAELRGGRAAGGQARRPPSPSPAPPPSRAPAVALYSPSSSVRGRRAATLPCSLGGERGRRSAAGRRGGDLHICPALATGPVHVRSDVAVHVGGQRWSETFLPQLTHLNRSWT